MENALERQRQRWHELEIKPLRGPTQLHDKPSLKVDGRADAKNNCEHKYADIFKKTLSTLKRFK